MRGKRELRRQIRGLLSDLGAGQTEMAGALRSLGIRAVPKDTRDCAVAAYLGAVVAADPRIKSLAVQADAVKVLLAEPTRFQWLNLVRVLLPEPVRQLISAFDQAVYPDLIRDGSGDTLAATT